MKLPRAPTRYKPFLRGFPFWVTILLHFGRFLLVCTKTPVFVPRMCTHISYAPTHHTRQATRDSAPTSTTPTESRIALTHNALRKGLHQRTLSQHGHKAVTKLARNFPAHYARVSRTQVSQRPSTCACIVRDACCPVRRTACGTSCVYVVGLACDRVRPCAELHVALTHVSGRPSVCLGTQSRAWNYA